MWQDVRQHQGGESRHQGGVMEETRRRCMKAKALQTIVTLYMTSSCYNNTAVIYCTVQERLNIWLDKADRRHLTSSMNNISSALILLFFSFFFFPNSLFLLINSTWISVYTYLEHNVGKKEKKSNIKKQDTRRTSQNFGEEHLYCIYKFSFFSSFFF